MMPGAQIAKRLPGRVPGSEKLLIYIQLPEQMFAKRVDFIALHFLAHRFENRRMRNHYRGHLVMHNLLSLFIQRHAFIMIGYRFRLGDYVIKRFVAPF